MQLNHRDESMILSEEDTENTHVHDWVWRKDWEGDHRLVNGIRDTSCWVCAECGEETSVRPRVDPDPVLLLLELLCLARSLRAVRSANECADRASS